MLWGHARNGQQVRGAAVNFPQRFGRSMNLNVIFTSRYRMLFAASSASSPVLARSRLLGSSEASSPQNTLPDEQNWQNTRLDWVTLLKRVYNIDAVASPCGGCLKFEELVVERDKMREHLQQRGLSPEPYTPRQKRQFNDRESYVAAPQEYWDQSLQDTPQRGDEESPLTESE